jgi:hypothetical protein
MHASIEMWQKFPHKKERGKNLFFKKKKICEGNLRIFCSLKELMLYFWTWDLSKL